MRQMQSSGVVPEQGVHAPNASPSIVLGRRACGAGDTLPARLSRRDLGLAALGSGCSAGAEQPHRSGGFAPASPIRLPLPLRQFLGPGHDGPSPQEASLSR